MIWFQIFWEFFKAGLFAAGGGLATPPFLYAISESTGWFSTADIANMIAISESTPGPLGVNMATYAGYQTLGIAGGIWATLSLTSPALFVITAVSKALDKFKNALLVEKIFYGLRPCSIALITAAGSFIILEFQEKSAEYYHYYNRRCYQSQCRYSCSDHISCYEIAYIS